jgi:hypothetical protein
MALVLLDRCQQTGTSNTTVSFTLTGTVTGFQSFAAVGNGNTTYYSAFDASGNWEVGIGTYSTTGPTLTRTTILSSSNSGSAVTFSGTVNVFVTQPSGNTVVSSNNAGTSGYVLTSNGTGVAPSWTNIPSVIPAGTVTNFIQATAPTGWTQVTTWNNYAFRVVSGTGGGTGGSVAFTTAFASQTPSGSVSTSISSVSGSVSIFGGSVSAYTLSTSEIPSHTHSYQAIVSGFGSIQGSGSSFVGSSADTSATGGGGSHSHGFTNPSGSFSFSSGSASSSFSGSAINLAVQYVDNIIASKN